MNPNSKTQRIYLKKNTKENFHNLKHKPVNVKEVYKQPNKYDPKRNPHAM